MRVLALDDDPETLELIAGALRRDGHETVRVENPRAALRALEDRAFDVLVLDVMLGRESGLDLCAALRRDGVSTPILFLSARGTVRARVDGLDAGGDDYLPKPFPFGSSLHACGAGRRGPGFWWRWAFSSSGFAELVSGAAARSRELEVSAATKAASATARVAVERRLGRARGSTKSVRRNTSERNTPRLTTD